jgi:nicotinamidase-related amidase
MASVLTIPARPEPLALEPARTVVLVVDMQNAFVSRGGYPLWIADTSLASGPAWLHDATVENVQRFLGWVTTTEEYLAALGGRPA